MAESDETAPGEAAPVARRYRYIVHVKEHTLLVPLSANATVAALTAEVDRRASRRQLVSSAVVDIQVRTAAGIGFLEPTDILTDVITEQEDLVAVLEGSAPVQRLSMVRRTRDAVSKFSLPRAPPRREEGAPAPPAASWTAPVVTIVAADAAPPEALAPAPELLAAPPPRRRPAASPQSAPGARRAPPAAERTDPLPVSLASKQHEYLSGLLEEIHRHDPTGVPAYKRRILSGLHARPLRSAPSARPLLRPALSARSLRAQLLEQPGGDGLPLIAPRAQSAGARARAPQPDGRAPLAERERQLHGLRAGVSKLQLDGMQLDEKVQALQRQLQRLQAQMAQARAETRMTNAQLMLADEKRRAAVLGRLKLAELRVSESLVSNAALKERANHFRREFKLLKRGLRAAAEKDASFSRDIRQLAAVLHAAMDDRQKVALRIERVQHDYRADARLLQRQLGRLDGDAAALQAAHTAKSAEMEAAADERKREQYVRTARWAKQLRGRGLQAGRMEAYKGWLQEQARQLEELVNVRLRPEEGGGAREVLAKYRQTEAHCASLMAAVHADEAQAAELGGEIRSLGERVAELERAARRAEEGAGGSQARLEALAGGGEPDDSSAEAMIGELLETLQPLARRAAQLLGCGAAPPAGEAAAGGLLECLAEVNRAVQGRLLRARQLKALHKLRAREQADAQALSPRSALALEEAAGFAREWRPLLDGFERMYDVAAEPYDLAAEHARLAAEANRREGALLLDLDEN